MIMRKLITRNHVPKPQTYAVKPPKIDFLLLILIVKFFKRSKGVDKSDHRRYKNPLSKIFLQLITFCIRFKRGPLCISSFYNITLINIYVQMCKIRSVNCLEEICNCRLYVYYVQLQKFLSPKKIVSECLILEYRTANK